MSLWQLRTVWFSQLFCIFELQKWQTLIVIISKMVHDTAEVCINCRYETHRLLSWKLLGFDPGWPWTEIQGHQEVVVCNCSVNAPVYGVAAWLHCENESWQLCGDGCCRQQLCATTTTNDTRFLGWRTSIRCCARHWLCQELATGWWVDSSAGHLLVSRL